MEGRKPGQSDILRALKQPVTNPKKPVAVASEKKDTLKVTRIDAFERANAVFMCEETDEENKVFLCLKPGSPIGSSRFNRAAQPICYPVIYDARVAPGSLAVPRLIRDYLFYGLGDSIAFDTLSHKPSQD